MNSNFIRDNPDLIRALRQAQDEKTDELIAASRDSGYVVSDTFQQNMARLIRAQRKPYYPLIRTNGRKTLLALAAALILMISLVFSVSALREPFLEFLVKTYEKFSSMVFVQSEQETTLPTALEQQYVPAYIPKGYMLNEENSVVLSSLQMLLFEGKQDTIEFQQFVLGSVAFTANTEGVQTEEVLIGNDVGLYYSNLGKQSLVWENDLYGFSLTGHVEQDELLAMARSLEEK
jgi:hypothetical protein